MIITKKQYMNNNVVTEFIIPYGVTGIEDYAFAQCTNLRRIALPDTVKELAVNAFVECESLESAYIYSSEGRDCFSFDMSYQRSEMLARILAIALREFAHPFLCDTGSVGSSAWFAGWDDAFMSYLMSPDDRDFMPFLAGGEEDYESEQSSREGYTVKTRIKKASYIIDRLLAESICPASAKAKEAYIVKLKQLSETKDREALLALSQRKEHIKETVEIFERNNLLTEGAVSELIELLPDEAVELKAFLIGRRERDVFESLKL